MYKTRIKHEIKRNFPLDHIKLPYQLTIKNLNLKADHDTGDTWFIHGTKHRKENQLLSMGLVSDTYTNCAILYNLYLDVQMMGYMICI